MRLMGTMEERGGLFLPVAGKGLHLTRLLEDNHGEHCWSVDFVALRAQSPLKRLYYKHGHGGGVMY